MVSNARLDLPDPESPVTTTRLSRGISTVMFLRLWTRAPCTATVFLTGAWSLGPGAFLGDIGLARIEERQFLQRHCALPRRPNRRRHLAQVPFVGQVLARQHHALDAERPLEVVLDFARRARVA